MNLASNNSAKFYADHGYRRESPVLLHTSDYFEESFAKGENRHDLSMTREELFPEKEVAMAGLRFTRGRIGAWEKIMDMNEQTV